MKYVRLMTRVVLNWLVVVSCFDDGSEKILEKAKKNERSGNVACI